MRKLIPLLAMMLWAGVAAAQANPLETSGTGLQAARLALGNEMQKLTFAVGAAPPQTPYSRMG